MDFLKKYNLTPVKILKITGLVIVALFLASFALQLLGGSTRTLNTTMQSIGREMVGMAPSMAPMMDGDYATDEMAYGKGGGTSSYYPSPIPVPSGTTGNDAEEYEVTDYSAHIETHKLNDTCSSVSALKAHDYVIFENASENKHGCSFTFKVEKAHTEEVLGVLRALDPRELSENTYTIKGSVEGLTDQLEILTKKRDSIKSTLDAALRAYDDVTRLATQSQNADALARIISSKVNTIQQLTQEQININAQIDQLIKSKADQLDRLDYTYFYVSVSEIKYADWDNIKDSWKSAVQTFVYNINQAIQNVTVNLIATLIGFIPLIIYFFVALFAAKYGWKYAVRIWKDDSGNGKKNGSKKV